MPPNRGGTKLSQAQWTLLEPLVEACGRKGQPVPLDTHKSLQAIEHLHTALADEGL